jgi:hypothetical protein
MIIKFPFECDPSGFYDVIRAAERTNPIEVGIFPIGDTEDADDGSEPPPTLKKISFTLEAVDRPKISQKPKSKSYLKKKEDNIG